LVECRGSKIYKAGIPIRIYTGIPIRIYTAGIPIRINTAGIPIRIYTAGIPIRIYTAGIPIRINTAGIPIRIYTAGTTRGCSSLDLGARGWFRVYGSGSRIEGWSLGSRAWGISPLSPKCDPLTQNSDPCNRRDAQDMVTSRAVGHLLRSKMASSKVFLEAVV